MHFGYQISSFHYYFFRELISFISLLFISNGRRRWFLVSFQCLNRKRMKNRRQTFFHRNTQFSATNYTFAFTCNQTDIQSRCFEYETNEKKKMHFVHQINGKTVELETIQRQ